MHVLSVDCPVSGSVFNIDFAVGVFRHVYLVNVWGIVSAAKCVCTNYRSPEYLPQVAV